MYQTSYFEKMRWDGGYFDHPFYPAWHPIDQSFAGWTDSCVSERYYDKHGDDVFHVISNVKVRYELMKDKYSIDLRGFPDFITGQGSSGEFIMRMSEPGFLRFKEYRLNPRLRRNKRRRDMLSYTPQINNGSLVTDATILNDFIKNNPLICNRVDKIEEIDKDFLNPSINMFGKKWWDVQNLMSHGFSTPDSKNVFFKGTYDGAKIEKTGNISVTGATPIWQLSGVQTDTFTSYFEIRYSAKLDYLADWNTFIIPVQGHPDLRQPIVGLESLYYKLTVESKTNKLTNFDELKITVNAPPFSDEKDGFKGQGIKSRY